MRRASIVRNACIVYVVPCTCPKANRAEGGDGCEARVAAIIEELDDATKSWARYAVVSHSLRHGVFWASTYATALSVAWRHGGTVCRIVRPTTTTEKEG